MFGSEPVEIYLLLLVSNPWWTGCRDGVWCQALGFVSGAKHSHLFWGGPFNAKGCLFLNLPSLQCLLDGYLWCMKVQIELVDKSTCTNHTHTQAPRRPSAVRDSEGFQIFAIFISTSGS